MTTEVALLPLKAGSNPHDASSSVGTIVQEALTTVLGQPGCERVFWGTEEENPGMMRWFVQWKSVDDHKTFMAHRDYGPFLKNLGSIMDGPPTIFHTSLPNHPASHIFTSPATELLTLFFDSSVDAATTDSSLKQFVSVLEKVNKDNSTYYGSTQGWADELVNGQKTYFLAFGWESVQAHQDARARAKTNKEMQDAMPLLKELPGHKDTQMVHAKLRQQDG